MLPSLPYWEAKREDRRMRGETGPRLNAHLPTISSTQRKRSIGAAARSVSAASPHPTELQGAIPDPFPTIV